MPDAGRHRIAVDVGGTFIDLVLLDEATGEITIDKQPSTPDALVQELCRLIDRQPVPAEEVAHIFHGTTAGINALVQESGARTGLITTEGFRDVLALGRGRRRDVYDAIYRPPDPLVPRRLRREVRERIASDGAVLTALDVGAVARQADALVEDGVEAIAVCFLNAYVNPSHEREAARLIRERHPGVPVSTSTELVTEWREYERTSTTVLNSYIQPLLQGYVTALESELANARFTGSLAIMQSNGGVMSAPAAGRRPIRTMLSGPAGGVIGVQALAAELGYKNVICADVGGTTYDVALIEDGRILETTATEVGGRSIVGSVIDIVSIGAGGGSIAYLDETGALQVGPRSAGARPGPACYGLGGLEPTVTDCQLLLGQLDPDTFLGARMTLDLDAAEDAVADKIARPTGTEVLDAAAGILRVATTNMVYAIRALTVERGIDPRDFVLCSYGGGGGLFAAEVAAQLDVATVVIPPAPATFSAMGIMMSDYRADASTTRIQPLERDSLGSLRSSFAELAAEASAELRAMGFGEDETVVSHHADVRFTGQDDALTVSVDAAWMDDDDRLLSGIRERFVALHNQLYGYGPADARLEIVNGRCRAMGAVPHAQPARYPGGESIDPRPPRQVCMPGEARPVQTRVVERSSLTPGDAVLGPAIVDEWTTTILVPPAWRATADHGGTLILRTGGGTE